MNVLPKKVLNFEHKNTANFGILYVFCLRDSCRIQSGARSATDCSGGRDPLEIPPHHGGIGRPLAAKKLTPFASGHALDLDRKKYFESVLSPQSHSHSHEES